MDVFRRNGREIAIFNLIAIAAFWVSLVVAGAITPGYSQRFDATSELGAIGQPYWWLNAFFGIVPVAIATFLTGWIVLARYRPGALAWISGIATIIGGAAFLMAGVSRCDVGCEPSPLLSANVHMAGAGIGFNILLFGPLVLGLRSFTRERNGFYLTVLAIGLCYWCTLLLFASGRVHETRWLGFGFWQKTTILLLCAWVASVAVNLLRRDDTAPAELERDASGGEHWAG